MERTIRLTLEYVGTRFHGWQRQVRLRTVQGELEDALGTVLRHPVSLAAAGRTDAGVHALGQVASFRTASDLPPERIRRGANALTGSDLVVTAADEADVDFHARFSARARHYAYVILERPSALWADRAFCPRRFPDLEAMSEAAGHLAGDHDFAEFSCRGDEETSTRSVVHYAHWQPWARGIVFRIGAVRFLYRMVRCLVGASLEIGWGRADPARFRARLADPQGRGRNVAPAAGLYFCAADYEVPPGGVDCQPPGPVV